jgi:hypothetical protein
MSMQPVLLVCDLFFLSLYNTKRQWLGLRIGQVRVVFAIPPHLLRQSFPADVIPRIPTHLVYIELFTPFKPHPNCTMVCTW